MRVDILTLFPKMVEAAFAESIIARARDRGFVVVHTHNIRDYTENKQKQVDDYPYGGGTGMVMQADPLFNCLEAVKKMADGVPRVVYMSPQGRSFVQAEAKRLLTYGRLVLICGHYEGVDERFIEECVDEELSLGDFVLTGGEIPALAVCDAVCRLVPGVLASDESYMGESHWDGTLEHPHYSRPEVWRGRAVPSVLLSGNHAEITKWRRGQSLLRTKQKRPDLFSKLRLTKKDVAALSACEQADSADGREGSGG